MSLRSVNLNLVPILLTLLRSRSVSHAAEQMGLTQGAASNALARLRETFDDKLLVRVGAHMELTPRAVELIAPAEALCAGLESLFSRPRFDPAQADRTFVIAAADYATFVVAGPLLAAIAKVAPGVQLRFVDVVDELNQRMAEREIDVAIVPESFIRLLAPANLRFSPIVEEISVAMFRDGHALSALPSVTEQDLAPYRMIAFHPSSELIERKAATAFLGGHAFDVAAFIPQVTIAPYLLLGNDSVTIMPRRIADRMAAILPLQVRPLAFGSQQFRIVVAWSPVHDTDPAHIWFRDIIHRSIAMPAPRWPDWTDASAGTRGTGAPAPAAAARQD